MCKEIRCPNCGAFLDNGLDRHITGNYGEDQFPRGHEKCDECARQSCTEYPTDCEGPYDECETCGGMGCADCTDEEDDDA